MASTTTTAATRIAIALVAAFAFGSLFAGSIAHADTWMSSSTQSWGHNNDHNWNNNGSWNNGGWNHNWNNDNDNNWNNGGWNHHEWNHGNNWGNNWNHGDHDWWRWHRIGSQWQQYFDWTLYCQWAYQNYGYVSAQCAPYVYSGYNNYNYGY